MNFKNKTFLMVLLMFFLVGTVFSAVYAGGDEKTITIVLTDYPLTLDPVAHGSRITQGLHRLYSDALQWITPEGNVVLELAESITMIDSRTYEIKIREDVYFHNGDHMTADDLVFSLIRQGMPEGMEGVTSRRVRHAGGPFESVEKIDDYTVLVKKETPEPIRQSRIWEGVDIWPKKYFEEVGGIEGFIKYPIGTGPFKWVEGDLENFIVLERFEDYYGGCPERPGEVDRIPPLDRVIVKYAPEISTRLSALLTGEADIIQQVPIDYIKLIEDNPNTELVETLGTRVAYLALNTNKPPFDDQRVRQAIAYAINYDLIVEQMYLGYSEAKYGRPFSQPFPGEAGYGAFDHIEGYEYNPQKARALLEEAGVTGLSFIIDTTLPVNEEAQAVAQMLGDIGIEASIRVWELGVLESTFVENNRDAYYAFRGFGTQTPEGIQPYIDPNHRVNFSQYNNPYLLDLFAQAAAIEEDSPERNALFIEAFEIILEELPVIWVHQPRALHAIQSHVKNYFAYPTEIWNLQRVDIE